MKLRQAFQKPQGIFVRTRNQFIFKTKVTMNVLSSRFLSISRDFCSESLLGHMSQNRMHSTTSAAPRFVCLKKNLDSEIY